MSTHGNRWKSYYMDYPELTEEELEEYYRQMDYYLSQLYEGTKKPIKGEQLLFNFMGEE